LVIDSQRSIAEVAREIGVGEQLLGRWVAAELSFPRAQVRHVVPTAGTVRKGDFGEMVAMGIYSTKMDRTVPYTKLQLAKPVANATTQGADTVCLTITQGEDLEPVSVEAKCRPIGRPSDVLDPIEKSSKTVTYEYLVQAWAAGVQLMLSHPDHARHFAYSAAQHLGRLNDPDAPLPPHLRHAVAVVGEDRSMGSAGRSVSNCPPGSSEEAGL